MQVKLIISIVFILLSRCTFANEIPTFPIHLNQTENKSFTLGLLIDSTKNLTISDILLLENSAKAIHSQFPITSIENNYWFVLKLENTTNEKVRQIIGFNEACFEVADIYYLENNEWKSEQNGLVVPINQRSMNSRWPVFEVNFQPHETKKVYLKLHSKYIVPVKIICEPVQAFRKLEQKQLIGHSFYFGAAIVMLFYNLFLFFQIKDRTYLYYVSYLFFLILWVSLWSGFFIYLSSNLKLYHLLSAGVPLLGLSVILFTNKVLNIKQLSKTYYHVLKVLIGISLLLFGLVVFDIKYYQYIGIFGIVGISFLLYLGFHALFKGITLARFYVFATSFYLIGLVLISALTLNIVNFNFVTRFGFMIGSFMEFTIFSFALGYRIRNLQREKFKIHEQLLFNERSMKELLVKEVEERTHELKLTNEKLLISNQSKDKLFSIIAHDLKSPFNSILGYIDLLKSNYKSYSEEDKLRMIDNVQLSSVKAFEILNNLLIWAKSQTKGISFKPQSIDLTEFISTIVTQLRPVANQKYISIDFIEYKKINIVADREMLKVVFRNLITNSVKFTQAGGKITIQLTDVSNHEINIAVSDTGCGIQPEKISNIFKLVPEKSTSGTNNEKGTGLGLVLCKDFIDLHNGKIWVESQLGLGSTFNIRLPKT